MRLHTRRLNRFNQLGGAGDQAIKTLILGDTAAISIGTGTFTTVNVTTISGVSADINNVVADVKLTVPTSAYTGSSVAEGAFYTTGNKLYVARGGAWKSGFTFAESTFTKLTASSKLILPTTAYTGAGMTEGAVYATGSYLYLGRGGAWKSGLFG